MDREELLRHLEFEYWGYIEAARRDAEAQGIPFEPMDQDEYLRRRGIELTDEERRI